MSRRTIASALLALTLAVGGIAGCSDSDSPAIEGDGAKESVDVTPDDLGDDGGGTEAGEPDAPDGGQESGTGDVDVTPDDLDE